MSDAVVIQKKEAVEAEMKREAQAMAEGLKLDEIREKKEVVVKEETAKAPPYIKFFAIYDKANKQITTLENLDNTTLRAGKVKGDLKALGEQFFSMNHDLEDPDIQELNSSLKGYSWLAYCNKMELKLFLLYPRDCRKTDVKTFMSQVNGFVEKIGDEEKIKKDIKKLLVVFLERKAKKKDTNTKFDELKVKTDAINQKVAKQLGGMTTNFENVHRTDILADNLKQEAAKIKEQAEALADLTGGTSMITIIMILVGCLLLIAVFGNLYVQINAPPPKRMKAGMSSQHRSRALRIVRRFFKAGWKVLKKMGRGTEHLLSKVEHIFNRRSTRLRKNTENRIYSKAHQRAILKNLMNKKARVKKKLEAQRIKAATPKLDLAYSSIFKKEKMRNRFFSLADYVTGRVAVPLKRGPVVHVSSFIGGGNPLSSKVGLLI